jgi:uncharacterized membrane protein
MSDPKEFKELLNEGQIVAAIRNAESKTSAEIRVFISNKQIEEPVASAQAAFVSLGMNQTSARNGVLIFVAPCSQKFAVIGDAGIHEKCGDPFWQELAAAMTGYFQKSEFTAGIIHGITRAGEILATHFPRQSDDKNELPDEIGHD